MTTNERVGERGRTTDFFGPYKIKSLQIINCSGFLLQTSAEKNTCYVPGSGKRNKSHSTPGKSVLQENGLENIIVIPWHKGSHGGMHRPRDIQGCNSHPGKGAGNADSLSQVLRGCVVFHRKDT